MANKTELLVEGLVHEILPEEFELVDTEYVKEGSDWYLRIFVDKKAENERITLNDCQQISHIVSELLDKKDLIKEHYMLEISSPGLDRALKKERDFIRERGKEVELKLYKALDGRKEYDGTLIGLTEDDIVQIQTDKKILEINRKEIAIIRLKVVF
ncbi:MAG: ribosome maturation factor RimP [Peptostreptococcaceae bacterium]|nr:ribosome maturation factor RimP [Peptostreptococcaceae bacterium]